MPQGTAANLPDPDEMDQLTAGEIAELPLSHLANLMEEAKECKLTTGIVVQFLESCINLKYGPHIDAAFKAKDEPLGTARINDDELDLVITTPKKVVWSAQVLENISKTSREEWDENPAEYCMSSDNFGHIEIFDKGVSGSFC